MAKVKCRNPENGLVAEVPESLYRRWLAAGVVETTKTDKPRVLGNKKLKAQKETPESVVAEDGAAPESAVPVDESKES